MQIRRLAIVANKTKPGALELAGELTALCNANGVVAEVVGEYPLRENSLEGFDACAVLGGDGTLLGVVPAATACQVPIFGINRGKLGFLANFPSADAAESMKAIFRGDFRVEKRMLLECGTADGSAAIALNDIVVKTTEHTRMAMLDVFSGGSLVNKYRCDGLIFTTPTGSTAYNLAAGGPLIHPATEVFALTPICPHTLSNRTLILPTDIALSIRESGDSAPLEISVDGVLFKPKCRSFPVAVRVHPQTLPLIQPARLSHFEILRNKLRWE